MGRRLFTYAVAVATVAASGVLVPGVGAFAAPAASPDLEQMEEYPPAQFTREAAQLPAELVEALDRDIDITGAEYLAQAAAATQAVIVVTSLREAGIEVLGSRMEDTELVVNVEDGASAALVEETGATAEIGEPEAFELDRPIRTTTDLWDGQGYYWSDDPLDQSGYVCTTGFQGFNDTNGNPEFVTAGHCLDGAEGIVGPVSALVMASPNVVTNFFDIGVPLVSTRKWGTAAGHVNYDVSRVAVTYPSVTPQPGVLTWGYGGGAPGATPRTYMTGQSAAMDNSILCASGMRTGWRCGYILEVDYDANSFVDENGTPIPGLHVNSIVAQICALPGDSGGSAIVGTNAVGIASWSTASGSCTSEDVAGFFPMVSTDGSKATVATAYTDWEIEVQPPAPVITSAQGAVNPTTITGTVPASGRSAANSVALYLDGASTPYATDATVTSGAWSIGVSGVGDGVHTYTVVTKYATYSSSTAVAGTFNKNVTTARIAGSDRYDVAAQIATQTFPSGADWVFIATGEKYPDALSAAPAAIRAGGPLLLTPSAGLTANTITALQSLDPANVVIVGGTASVTPQVEADILEALPGLDASDITRLGGTDRYDASRNIARFSFPASSVSTAYITTGLNFPDALSAGGAGGLLDRPVVLVQGTAATIDPDTVDLLDDLGVTEVIIAGGPNSVSAGIASSLGTAGFTVSRLAGADRFAASVSINGEAYVEEVGAPVTQAFIATGFKFPDALAGAVMAGTRGGPLYVSQATCVPFTVLQQMGQLGVDDVTLFGGTSSLSAGVQSLLPC